jgi:hypothetical protein
MTTMFMETTQVEDTKTVSEIQYLLSKYGASSVSVDYASGGIVDSVKFCLKIGERHINFRLPCRYKIVESLLRKSGKKIRRGHDGDGDEQGKR